MASLGLVLGAVLSAPAGVLGLTLYLSPFIGAVLYTLPVVPTRAGWLKIKEVTVLKSFWVALAWGFGPGLLLTAGGAALPSTSSARTTPLMRDSVDDDLLPVVTRLWILRIHRLQRLHEDTGYQGISVPLAVRRDHVHGASGVLVARSVSSNASMYLSHFARSGTAPPATAPPAMKAYPAKARSSGRREARS